MLSEFTHCEYLIASNVSLQHLVLHYESAHSAQKLKMKMPSALANYL